MIFNTLNMMYVFYCLNLYLLIFFALEILKAPLFVPNKKMQCTFLLL